MTKIVTWSRLLTKGCYLKKNQNQYFLGVMGYISFGLTIAYIPFNIEKNLATPYSAPRLAS